MPSDEEILERAFLSALRKHFKKPGPWLPIESKKANEVFKPEAGQIWEVYVSSSSGFQIMLNGISLSNMLSDLWQPALSSVPNEIVGEIGTPGMSDTALNYTYTQNSATEGWLLGENDSLTVAGTYKLRRRRRFDLET